MLGKVFYKENWHLLRFEYGKLEIFKEKCSEKPLLFRGEEVNLNDDSLLTAILEDGRIYIFDINSGCIAKDFSEYFLIVIYNINYFVSDMVDTTKFKWINSINKLVFVNGILKPMLELSKPLTIDVDFGNVKAQVKFYIEECKNNLLFKMGDYSKMLTSNPNIEQEYKMSIEFGNKINLNLLNHIIDNIIKFLSFFNFDLFPYINKIIIETEDNSFLYYKNTVNYKEKYIRKWNYLNNCKSKFIINTLEKIKDEKYDIGFIGLLNLEQININDVWSLAKSIESIGDENDLTNKVDEEISMYKELKNKIKQTIDDFEKDNKFKIEEQKKCFILNLIEISVFRKKLTNILNRYNNFSKEYQKYEELTDEKIDDYSKIISVLRNSIHGKTTIITSEELRVIKLTIFALYLYLLDEFGCDNKFNLVQMMFNWNRVWITFYHFKFNLTVSYNNCDIELDILIDEFRNGHLEKFRTYGKLLKRWKPNIKNSFIRIENKRLSNVPMEGINSRIKTILKSANGIKQFYRLKNRIIYSINKDIPIKTLQKNNLLFVWQKVVPIHALVPLIFFIFLYIFTNFHWQINNNRA